MEILSFRDNGSTYTITGDELEISIETDIYKKFEIYADDVECKVDGIEKSDFGEYWSGSQIDTYELLGLAAKRYLNDSLDVISVCPELKEAHDKFCAEKIKAGDKEYNKYCVGAYDNISELFLASKNCLAYASLDTWLLMDAETREIITDMDNFVTEGIVDILQDADEFIFFFDENNITHFIDDYEVEVRCSGEPAAYWEQARKDLEEPDR